MTELLLSAVCRLKQLCRLPVYANAPFGLLIYTHFYLSEKKKKVLFEGSIAGGLGLGRVRGVQKNKVA